MKKLEIPEGEKTPSVLFDPEKNIYSVKGRSFPEHSEEFYKPVCDWLRTFFSSYSSANPIEFHFDLFYLNSASLVSVKNVISVLKKQLDEGNKIAVVWHYDPDDNDIRRTGEDYAMLVGIPLRFEENQDTD